MTEPPLISSVCPKERSKGAGPLTYLCGSSVGPAGQAQPCGARQKENGCYTSKSFGRWRRGRGLSAAGPWEYEGCGAQVRLPTPAHGAVATVQSQQYSSTGRETQWSDNTSPLHYKACTSVSKDPLLSPPWAARFAERNVTGQGHTEKQRW